MAEPAWLALLPPGVEAAGATVAVARHLDGSPAGMLATWRHTRRPHAEALRVAPEVVADGPGAGPATTGRLAVSVVIVPRGRRPLFDDPAVVEAARAVMRDPARAALVSTLVIDAVHWAGSVSAVTAEVATGWPGWWDTDPYARLAPAVRLLVEPGVLVPHPLPAGPGTQRYSGAPWPAGSFAQ